MSTIDQMLLTNDLGESGEHRDILETYRLFAEDRGWFGRMQEAIASGLTAEAAVQRVREDTAARMRQVVDPYIRERMADLEDLAMRLLRHLSGEAETAARARASLPPENAVWSPATWGLRNCSTMTGAACAPGAGGGLGRLPMWPSWRGRSTSR